MQGERARWRRRGSYDAILRSLREVAPLLPRQIGGTFTRGTWRGLPRLLDDLAASGLGPDVVLDVRFDPVLQERAGAAAPDFHGVWPSAEERWLAEATVTLRGELVRRGYRPPRSTPALRPSVIDPPHQLVVGVDGSFWKCPAWSVGRSSVSGTSRGARGVRRSHGLDTWKNEECLACAYLPLCFGGCRHLKLLRDGGLAGVNCRKPFLNAMLEPMAMRSPGLENGAG